MFEEQDTSLQLPVALELLSLSGYGLLEPLSQFLLFLQIELVINKMKIRTYKTVSAFNHYSMMKEKSGWFCCLSLTVS